MEKWDNSDLKRYRFRTLEDFSETAGQYAQQFLEGAAWSLYLHGVLGTKKTSLAAAILRAWRDKQLPMSDRPANRGGIFLPIYAATKELRSTTGGYNVTLWERTPLLVIDDIDSARNTPHVSEQLLHLIERRYDNELKTIITSALTPTQLAEHFDARIASRLQEGLILDLGETDFRKQKK